MFVHDGDDDAEISSEAAATDASPLIINATNGLSLNCATSTFYFSFIFIANAC